MEAEEEVSGSEKGGEGHQRDRESVMAEEKTVED